jgi:hypothetical protein
MVRAKFKVVRIERVLDGPSETQTIVLSPVYANGDPEHENTKFWKYTPSGEIRLSTVNTAAAEQFAEGGEFYVDFTRADS